MITTVVVVVAVRTAVEFTADVVAVLTGVLGTG